MTPERWQSVKQLYHQALDQDPEGRAAFLERACAGDATLLREVATLLSSEKEAASFIEKPAKLEQGPAAEMLVGRRIGPYRVVRPIGQGGMGAVYLAVRDDETFRKEVAIKLVRAWADSDYLVERFRQERRILAALDHPNIAKLLDGGATEEGLPYLVMEYVEGVPIDEHCDALPVPERLRLYRTVCAAVHFAHQNLIVHRDIKPANILITADGTPKLLDFGIAKLLSRELASRGQTATVFPMMTPEYASPEQSRNEPISTASDVYALGVLLYRLLTGQGPYRLTTGAVLEIIEAVRDQEPERPSAAVARKDKTLARRLRGDLDNIVLRALRKEPRERYPSVEVLSADIGRHLGGQPITARKATVAYRAEKFVRRHKVGVGAAALVLVALVGGIVSTARETRIARAERARAERRFNDVRKLANSFLFEFHDTIKDLPGSTTARALVVKKALEYLDGLAQEAGGDRSLQRELAEAYERVGDVQGRLYHANLGDTAGARSSYRKAVAVREALAATDPKDRKLRRDLSESYLRIGETLFATGDPSGAAEMERKAVAIAQDLAAEEPSNRKAQERLAITYAMLGLMLAASGDAGAGLESSRKAVVLFESLAATAPEDANARQRLAVAYGKVGDILGVSSDHRSALEMYRKALAVDQALVAANPANTSFLHGLIGDHTSSGDAQMKLGELPAALESFRQALAIVEPLSTADPANRQYRAELAIVHQRIGTAQAELGKVSEAMVDLRKALAIHEADLAADPSNVMVQARLADSAAGLGKAYSNLAEQKSSATERARNWREARSWYQRGHDIWLKLRNIGAATGEDAARSDELARDIARCDAALAKLESVTSVAK